MRSEGYEGLWDTGWAGDSCRLPCRARIFHLHLPRLSDRAEGPAWRCRKGGGCCGASVRGQVGAQAVAVEVHPGAF